MNNQEFKEIKCLKRWLLTNIKIGFAIYQTKSQRKNRSGSILGG
jgi:hypothetical protein